MPKLIQTCWLLGPTRHQRTVAIVGPENETHIRRHLTAPPQAAPPRLAQAAGRCNLASRVYICSLWFMLHHRTHAPTFSSNALLISIATLTHPLRPLTQAHPSCPSASKSWAGRLMRLAFYSSRTHMSRRGPQKGGPRSHSLHCHSCEGA